MTRSLARRRQDGFTMVELLITILIVTVGILGLAKMQATAVSNTAVSRTRALMTYQAESLAGMIRSNRSFWVTSGNVATWPAFNVSTAGAATNTGMTTVAAGACTGVSAACDEKQMAYDDMVNTWTPQFIAAFPGASAAIACVPATGSSCTANPTSPHSYDITLTWSQKMVAMSKTTQNTQTSTQVSMVMHVQP
ncbi:MAG: type IV pilus modification protein PilV [Burkholderiaceae bacterium]